MIKIPAHAEGVPAIERDDRRGHQRQRHADLLPRPLRRGHRGLPHRARAAASPRGGDLVDGRVGGVVLRQPGRHRDRPPPPRGPARCGARPRWPTPSSPTSCSGAASPGPRWEALAAKGARVQRPLWASTSTKNPAYSAHALRRRAHRPRHRQHARAGVDRRAAARRGQPARRHRHRGRRRRAPGDGRPRRPRASTSTT